MNKRVNPESVLPRQEVVSRHVALVHESAKTGKPLLATIALDDLIKAGKRVDYEAIGVADNAAYDAAQTAQTPLEDLDIERTRKRLWVAEQNGANASPALIKRITTTLRRIDRIGTHEIPRAEVARNAADLNTEEISSLAEITGEAWPYYPDLARQASAALVSVINETVNTPSDRPVRQTVHNIISRLSTDKTLGIPYNKFTTHLFANIEADEKARIAKILPIMKQDGEINIWNEAGTMYITSVSSTSHESGNTKHLIVLEMDLDDELTRQLIADIHAQLGSDAYRRIENDSDVELQVPRVFAKAFADTHGLSLVRRGPSSYRLSAN